MDEYINGIKQERNLLKRLVLEYGIMTGLELVL